MRITLCIQTAIMCKNRNETKPHCINIKLTD